MNLTLNFEPILDTDLQIKNVYHSGDGHAFKSTKLELNPQKAYSPLTCRIRMIFLLCTSTGCVLQLCKASSICIQFLFKRSCPYKTITTYYNIEVSSIISPLTCGNMITFLQIYRQCFININIFLGQGVIMSFFITFATFKKVCLIISPLKCRTRILFL